MSVEIWQCPEMGLLIYTRGDSKGGKWLQVIGLPFFFCYLSI